MSTEPEKLEERQVGIAARKRKVLAISGSALVAVLLVSGCTSRGHGPSAPSSGQDGTIDKAAPLAVRIELPSRAMKAGSTMNGQVVVSNNTGAAIQTTGCVNFLQVALASPTYQPSLSWLDCHQTFTIPTGQSLYQVTVVARTIGCTEQPGHDTVPKCVHGLPPALPPGRYQAQLYQALPDLPDATPIPVSVTS